MELKEIPLWLRFALAPVIVIFTIVLIISISTLLSAGGVSCGFPWAVECSKFDYIKQTFWISLIISLILFVIGAVIGLIVGSFKKK